MVIEITIGIVLLLLNVFFIKRSNRKRKYGIFPGRISLIMVGLLGCYYLFILITHTQQTPPVLTKQKKANTLVNYQNQLNQYMKEYNRKEKNIARHYTYVYYVYVSVILQASIALLYSVFGLINIPSRRKFYWLTTVSYVAGMLIIAATDWYLN